MNSSGASPKPDLQKLVLVGCAVLALAVAILADVTGWNHNLMDQNGFRQTQTAISIDYLLRGGPWLTYETPIFGPPWSWPMEFPLFQWCVAMAVKVLKTPIDQTSRFVSLLFFYLSFWPIYAGLKSLRLARSQRLPFLILLLCSPLYLFWSRTCMIESCAICLGVWYLYFGSLYCLEGKWWHLALAAILGSLLAVVKVTTLPAFAFLGVAIVAAPILSDSAWREWRARIGVRQILYGIAIVIVPFLLATRWAAFADSWKVQNAITANFVSSSYTQRLWIFGTLHDRLSKPFLRIIFRTVGETTGSPFLPLLFLAALPVTRTRWLPAACCLVAFGIPLLLFTPLYIEHNYYANANAIFLIGAMAFLIADLLEQGGSRATLGLLLLVAATFTGAIGYRTSKYYLRQANVNDASLLATADTIRTTVAPDKIVVVRGAIFSPVLLYYSGRRGILLDRGGPLRETEITDRNWDEVMGKVPTTDLGIMAFCDDTRKLPAEIERLTRRYGFNATPSSSDENCSLYYPRR